MLRRPSWIVALALAGCPKAESTTTREPDERARPSKTSTAEGGKLSGILDAHNAERAKVGVAPLQWSKPLARHAQEWADRLAARGCALEHRRDDAYGENLFWSSDVASASAVVDERAAEKAGYDHRKNRCKGTCGHYTQVVWSSSRSLGCGMARCGNGEVWVCNYDPPGNFVGERPY